MMNYGLPGPRDRIAFDSPPMFVFTAAALSAFGTLPKPKAGRPLTIRKEFPESWIWESLNLENG